MTVNLPADLLPKEIIAMVIGQMLSNIEKRSIELKWIRSGFKTSD